MKMNEMNSWSKGEHLEKSGLDWQGSMDGDDLKIETRTCHWETQVRREGVGVSEDFCISRKSKEPELQFS